MKKIRKYSNIYTCKSDEGYNFSELQIRIADYDIEVDDDYEDNEDLLLNLYKSILSVKRKYILYTNKNTSVTQNRLERVFAYELYRQWSNRIQILYPKFVINGEPEKSPKLFSKLYSQKHTFPDLVMHHDQGDNDYQGVICEIKSSKINPYNFKQDMEKLCCFVCGRNRKYRFDYGVFILVGGDMGRILDIMDDIDGHVFKACVKSRTKRIICATYDGDCLQTARFDWLIKKKDRDILRENINNE